MWLLDKIRHSVERLPQELAHFLGEPEGDVCLPSNATLPNNLNNNVLTPDKIPEFCLPPKLFRRKSLALTPEGRKSPTLTPEGRKSPTLTPEGRKSPALNPEGGKSPALTPEGGKSPTLTPEGGKSPALTPEGGKSPALTPEGGKSPALTPEGGKSPALTPEGGKSPALTQEGRKSPALTPEGGKSPALTPEGRKSPALTPEGGKSPALTPEGRPERRLPSGARTQKSQAKHTEDTVTGACPGGAAVAAAAKTQRKKPPPPFSAEGYGLAGVYESPNTRRKESLFHGKCPGHVFDRSQQHATRAAKHAQQVPKKTLSLPDLLPLFLGKSLSETGRTESEGSSSSADSTPMGSPYSSLHVWAERAGNPVGAGASPSPHRPVQTGERGRRPAGEPSAGARLRLAAVAASAPGAHPLTLVPPAILPSEPLRRQEPPRREHALPLPCGGRVRLSAERTASSPASSSPTSAPSRLFTARVRVVSVEGLARDDADRRPVSCALSLCLVPGKLQPQKSATVRNCRDPVFNEDFFFTELSEESLAQLELRLKVMDRSTSGTLRRGAARAVVTKPLCQLFPPEG